MSQKIIQRGEIYWTDLTAEENKQKKNKINQVRKLESQKVRPVVVISNNQQK